MFKTTAIIVAIVIAGILIFAATRPDKTRRVMAALLSMKKMDIAKLKQASGRQRAA